MKKARMIMRTGTPVLSFDSTVNEAVQMMKQKDLGFVAINASSDRFQGVLTEAALTRAFLRFQSHPDKEALIFYRDLFEPVQLIHEYEDFPEVIKKVVSSPGHRTFVMNSTGNVIGHITAKDILHHLTEGGDGFQEESKVVIDQLAIYESFFEKCPFMMHSVDSEGKILMANQMLHAVLGYAAGSLLGKTIFDLYPPEAHESAKQGLKTIFDKGYHKVVQGMMLTADQKMIEVELVSKALENTQGEVIGTITVSRPLEMKKLLEVLPQI
ncbi:MAG: PAS domain S-box protein [Proteobacteria bacterium]|jgi:PAS domain S-box-containing protein|nr:PAS domain S-box protein [Pseudomonadota bacterium]